MTPADSDILDRLYAAPFDPGAMPDALGLIRRALDAESINVRLLDPRTGAPNIVAVSGAIHSDPKTHAAYFEHWLPFDSHMRAAIGGGRRIVSDDELVPPDVAARDPFINEFYLPTGCGPMIGWVDVGGGESGSVLGAIRARGRAAFSEDLRRRLEGLQEHVHRALRLMASAALTTFRADDLTAAHGAEGLALLRCAADGRVLLLAPGAEVVIAGLRAVRLSHGRLVWRDPKDERRFARLCRAAADRTTGEPFGFVSRDGDSGWLRVAASPAPSGDAVLVRLRRLLPEPALNPTLLQALFGLSPAEARIAIGVAEGGSLPELAARAEVTHATVRSQLRSVFDKTGVRRQSELAALLARLG